MVQSFHYIDYQDDVDYLVHVEEMDVLVLVIPYLLLFQHLLSILLGLFHIFLLPEDNLLLFYSIFQELVLFWSSFQNRITCPCFCRSSSPRGVNKSNRYTHTFVKFTTKEISYCRKTSNS